MWLSGRVLMQNLLGLEPSTGGKYQKGVCVRGRPFHMGAGPVVLSVWVLSIPQGPYTVLVSMYLYPLVLNMALY